MNLAAATASAGMNVLDAVRILRSAGGALLDQAALHGQLAQLEWEQEKTRLLRMLFVILLGVSCLICAMLFAGAVLLMAAWQTQYRLHAAAALTLIFALGVAIAWRRFQAWSALGGRVFETSREQFAADRAVLTSGYEH